MTGSSVSDLDLVRLCREEQGGDAFEELMTRYHGKVYGLIVRLVSDPERARDLTQETFLKAWKGINGFAGNAAFYTWLYRIARNVVNSDHRKVMSRPRVTLSLDGSQEGEDAPIDIGDTTLNPEDEVGRRERISMVAGAIRGLPVEFREIVVLRDIEGLNYEEISDILEIPVGTVRSRLHRARMDLKGRLEGILS